jgi:hypothetical protein
MMMCDARAKMHSKSLQKAALTLNSFDLSAGLSHYRSRTNYGNTIEAEKNDLGWPRTTVYRAWYGFARGCSK